MKTTFRLLLVAALAFPLLASELQAQFSWKDSYGKSPTEFSTAEWRAIIDGHWIAKHSTEEQLDLFDKWFTEIDTRYLVEGHEYLSHKGLQPDERVWFTQEDVAAGVDTVIKSAIAWIQTISTDTERSDLPRNSITVEVYPNPVQDRVAFKLSDLQPGDLRLTIHDTLGRIVLERSYSISQESNKIISWEIDSNMPKSQGLYLWTLQNNEKIESKAFVVVN